MLPVDTVSHLHHLPHLLFAFRTDPSVLAQHQRAEMRFSRKSYGLTLLAGTVFSAQAGLLPRSKAKGHLAFTKRDSNSVGDLSPAWPAKQDSELGHFVALPLRLTHRALLGLLLLAVPPSPAAIAEAQEQNTQLARQAYANLARISGGKAPAHQVDDDSGSSVSEDDADLVPDILRRAARPQKYPVAGHQVDTANEAGDGDSTKQPTKPLPALHRAHTYAARGLGKFQYGTDPIRGVNIGGWLVCA